MEDKLNDYQKELANFLKKLDCVKNELNELKEEGCNFFIRLEKECKDEKNTPYIPSDRMK